MTELFVETSAIGPGHVDGEGAVANCQRPDPWCWSPGRYLPIPPRLPAQLRPSKPTKERSSSCFLPLVCGMREKGAKTSYPLEHREAIHVRARSRIPFVVGVEEPSRRIARSSFHRCCADRDAPVFGYPKHSSEHRDAEDGLRVGRSIRNRRHPIRPDRPDILRSCGCSRSCLRPSRW